MDLPIRLEDAGVDVRLGQAAGRVTLDMEEIVVDLEPKLEREAEKRRQLSIIHCVAGW